MKMPTRILCIILAAVMVLSLVAVAIEIIVNAEDQPSGTPGEAHPISASGRNWFSGESGKKFPSFSNQALRDDGQSEYEDLVFTTPEEASRALAAGMEAHQAVIQVCFELPKSDYTEDSLRDAVSLVFKNAFDYSTGEDGIDYLRYLWCDRGLEDGSEYYDTDTAYQMNLYYWVDYYTTAQQEAYVDEQVAQILAGLDLEGKSDYEKIAAVYGYITENVTYDHGSNPLMYTAYAALYNHKAVCQGYAALFHKMMTELGIDSRMIGGFGGGAPHAWNVVKLDGKYFYADSTWDAGKTAYQYFLRSKAGFPSHQPFTQQDVEDAEKDGFIRFTIPDFEKNYPVSPANYDHGLTFYSTNLTLTDNLTLGYKVRKTTLTGTDPYVEFAVDGKTSTVTEGTEEGDCLVFYCRDLSAEQVDDTVNATLFETRDGLLYCGARTAYSVQTYCENTLKTAEKPVQTLIVDLLNFGTALQMYKDPDAGSFPSDILTPEQKTLATDTVPPVTDVRNSQAATVTDAKAAFRTVTLVLEDTVAIRVKFTAPHIAAPTVKVTDGEREWTLEDMTEENGVWIATFRGLTVAEMDKAVDFTVYDGADPVSDTFRYSIASYAWGKTGGNSALSRLLCAMLKYGQSAKSLAA